MTSPHITRRRALGGIGLAGLAGTSGVGLGAVLGAGAVAADNGGQNGDLTGSSDLEVTTSDVIEYLPNPILQTFGAIDFQPANMPANLVVDYVSPGGVRVAPGSAASAWFNCGIRLPVGARITDAAVYINPNGASRFASFTRYRPLVPTFENLISGSSTNGTSSERLPLPLDHIVEAGWNYRFDDISLAPGGAILYGAEVTYSVPADPLPPPPPPPTGLFVPFTGTNPRVYDSRNGDPKLAADEERVISLGVPGTIEAAVFNLTITQTEAAGFVSAFRADIPFPGSSSINWTQPGSDVANLVVCAVDSAGRIKLRGGNASTHIIVDLLGTFV